jgi:mono/diheme cytochrome c family protein
MSRSKIAGIFFLIFFIACSINPYQEGNRLYKVYCENCHMQDGKGLRGLIPPLANSDFLTKNKSQIPCIIKNGIKGTIIVNDTTYNTEMEGMPELSAVHINNIINYINYAWNNDLEESNIKDVEKFLQNCK